MGDDVSTSTVHEWRWVFISIGIATVVAAPILWFTGLSRAIAVWIVCFGVPTALIGLLLPRLGRRTRIAVIAAVLTVLVLLILFGCGLWFYDKILTPPRSA